MACVILFWWQLAKLCLLLPFLHALHVTTVHTDVNFLITLGLTSSFALIYGFAWALLKWIFG